MLLRKKKSSNCYCFYHKKKHGENWIFRPWQKIKKGLVLFIFMLYGIFLQQKSQVTMGLYMLTNYQARIEKCLLVLQKSVFGQYFLLKDEIL